MKGRPEEEVLRELMADMDEMDKERLGKKRHGPSITIAIGVPKGPESNEKMGDMESESMEKELEDSKEMPVPETPAMMDKGMSGDPMEEEEDDDEMFDEEETALIEEARALGIDDPEEIDMRLLKKLVERKRAKV